MSISSSETGSTSTGLAPNVAGALAYVLGPITGILFLVLEKENRFVRFHATQSIATGVVLIVLSIALSIVSGILAFIPLIGWLVALLLSLVMGFGSFVLWVMLMWRAYQGDEWEVPFVGTFARRLAPAALVLVITLAAAPAFAQSPAEGSAQLAPQGSSFSLSPYVGVVMPTANLLTLSQGTGTGTQSLKLSTAITVGGRLGIMFNSRVGLQADVGYSPGSLNFDSTGVKTNTDVTTTSGVGKLVLFLIPSTSPVWLSVTGGGGAIRHSFKNVAGSLSGLTNGTNIGAVIGAQGGIRLGQFIALTGSVEDYLYEASFDNSGTKTSEKRQHDVRITGGVRFPILGM